MTSQELPNRQVKNILINPRFQLKLLAYFIILFVITTISLYSTTYLFFWKLQQKAMKVGIPDGHVFYRFLENQKYDLDLLFIGLAVFNFALLLTVGFIISHRIAGPLRKLQSHLDSLNKNSDNFKLRQTDFFKELEPTVDKLRGKMQ